MVLKIPASLALALMTTAGTAPAAEIRQPVVVELFTSQGCSSCPPANANVAKLSQRPDVLALSFGVTYWDRLGWKDIFAKPEYTDRQEAYEPPLGHDGPFTPQVVVNGRADVVGNTIGPIESLIAGSRRSHEPTLSLEAGTIRIGAGGAPAGGADIWLVRYDPRVVEVPVRAGENSGRTLPHKNVVHSLTRIGTWHGETAALPLATAASGLRTAVLVQARNGGPILAAITD